MPWLIVGLYLGGLAVLVAIGRAPIQIGRGSWREAARIIAEETGREDTPGDLDPRD